MTGLEQFLEDVIHHGQLRCYDITVTTTFAKKIDRNAHRHSLILPTHGTEFMWLRPAANNNGSSGIVIAPARSPLVLNSWDHPWIAMDDLQIRIQTTTNTFGIIEVLRK